MSNEKLSEEQKCSHCKKVKSLFDFTIDKRRSNGRSTKCKICVYQIRLEYYKKYPEAEIKDRIQTAEFGRQWYNKNRDRLIIKMRNNHLVKKYGITIEQYEILLKKQNYKCLICKTIDPGRSDKNFKVDHDHKTGEVRGLLCHKCNVGLGCFKDNTTYLKKAIWYLNRRLQKLKEK